MKKFYVYGTMDCRVALSTDFGESDTMCMFDSVCVEEGDVAEAAKQIREHGYTVDESEIFFD